MATSKMEDDHSDWARNESWDSDDGDAEADDALKFSGCFFDAERFNPVYLGDSIVTWIKAPRNTDVPIVPSYVVSPSNFCVQFEHTRDYLRLLAEKLKEYCEDTKSLEYTYKKFEICAAYFRDQWHRAVVNEALAVDGKRTYEVHFLDFGFTSVVDAQDVRPLTRSFMLTPLQAYRCSLYGVTSVGATWTPNAVAYFKSIMDSSLVKSVRFVDEEDGRALVKLEVENPNMVKCDDVGQLLIDRGYAVKT